MTPRPDVIVIMTDEERAAPPTRTTSCAPGAARSLEQRGSTIMPSRSIGTTPVRSRASQAVRRCSPASTPTSTASPRPTGSASWRTTPGCAGCDRTRCRPSATGSALLEQSSSRPPRVGRSSPTTGWSMATSSPARTRTPRRWSHASCWSSSAHQVPRPVPVRATRWPND